MSIKIRLFRNKSAVLVIAAIMIMSGFTVLLFNGVNPGLSLYYNSPTSASSIGSITINVTPSGSEIQINGSLVASNVSQFNYTNVAYGIYNIVAYNPFYLYQSKQVRLFSSHVYVDFTLTKGSGVPNATAQYPWVPIGPYDPLVNQQPNGSAPKTAGHLGTMAIDYSNPMIMYLGTGSAASPTYGPYGDSGIFKTTDGGKIWKPADFGLPLDVVSSIIMNQSKPDELLAGFWDAGIYKTTDGGGYWFKVASYTYVSDLTDVNGTIYAASGDGIFGSHGSVIMGKDFGSSWSVLLNTTSPVSAISVSHDYIYALETMGSLWRSTDLGSSWAKVSLLPKGRGFVQSLSASPFDPNDVFAILADENTTYYSSDGGVNFTPNASLNGARVVTFDPQNSSIIWIMSPYYTALSTDGGISYTRFNPVGDQHNLYVNPKNSSTAYILTDQGIFQTNNSGESWFSDNGNLFNFLVYNFGIGDKGNWIVTSMQDFGAILTHDGGRTWAYGSLASKYGVYEGSIIYMNPVNSSWIYAFDVTNKRVVESNNGGLTYNVSIDLSSLNYTGYPPLFNQLFSIDPLNHSRLYFGSPFGVYNGTDFGKNWSFWAGSPDQIASLWVSPNGTVFVSNGTGLYYFSGGKWEKSIGISFPVASFAVDPLNSGIILITSGTNRTSASIYESVDSGKDFSLLERNPFNFPFTPPTQQGYGGAPVELFFLNITGNPLLATTNEGVFISTDLGLHWNSIDYNLLSGQATWAAFTNNSLYVSTYGEGMVVWHNFSLENLSGTITGNLTGYNGFSVKIDGTAIPVYDGHYISYVAPGKYNINISWSGGYKNLTETLSPMQTYFDNMSESYGITFVETGLPPASIWYVNITGRPSSGQIDTGTYYTSLINGTYSYSIGSMNDTYAASAGNLTVDGKSSNVTVSFSSIKKSPFLSGISDTELYGIIGGAVAVALIGSVWATRKKRR